jgi:glycosyltransferase involved in cell wall biosynthesis
MTRSDRIAFVCPRYAEGATVGGAETLLKSLAMRAASAGRKVTFLTTCAKNHFTWKNEVPPGARTVDGIEVIFFPVDENRDIGAFLTAQDKISRGMSVSRDDESTWLRNNVNSKALCDHLRAHGTEYDRVVMGPYLFGLIYFAAQIQPSRTMLVPCLHDEPFAYLESFKEMFHGVRGFMFNSVPERDLACRLYNLDLQKAPVVGMGLEPFDADPAAFSKKYGVSAPYVIYSGRREPLKGTPLLVDYMTAFRARTNRDVKVVFTGSGPIDPPSELAPHVIDLGFVSENDKHEAMAGAAAFCHPSINESLSIVILEAWLARTPALVRESSEVLRYQCKCSNGGLWFRNYPEFEEELMMLLENGKLRTSMGNLGREYVVREYSWKAVEPKLLDALDRD